MGMLISLPRSASGLGPARSRAANERDRMTRHRRPQWPASSTARLLAIVCLGLAILAGTPAARAQNDVQTLSDKVDRLQQELSDVERQVYNGQVPPSGSATGGDSAAAASQEVRIQQLETQISNLTGQLE